ncbi:MAG: SPOR domain-containing protein [Hyphomicrobiales bacterium]
MMVSKFLFASVSAAFLAASVAASGPAAAAENSSAEIVKDAYRALAGGQPQDAIAGFSLAIESRELAPEILANALLNRALAYQHLGQDEEALDDYTAALRLDAMSAQLRAMALYNRGLSQQKLKRATLAIEDYTSALFLDSSLSHAYYGRGNVLRDSGQYLFALSDYEKALRYKHPDAARVHYGEALTYEALKRHNQARAALELALAANPQFTPARQKLAMLDAAPTPDVALLEADPMPTGSISGTGVVIRKEQLPKPVSPSVDLAGAEEPALPERKTITDRIPAEEGVAAVPKPAPIEEKIIAIEPLPEADSKEAPQAATVAGAAANGWSVQIASANSETGAWSAWKKMQSRHPLLADAKPVVVRADLGTKGIFYRVRLGGFAGMDAAKDACRKLKAKGVACFVSKLNS